ncbi:hypothetical protein [uncultured Gordonia sp.]|uniref:hypothetical protein n=1 Tax=Gordonia sp. (in: high G+C Gram-positive bacteria) TaxID=84139 RepID=UPI000F916C9F|nr:hypothetical protein [uncultured Gordonia sp.]RUP41293.1 MAG: hypothetical protein EKK60_02170 [Gordonia sp. (in: high G+C Gram-positive bacteria)]
MIEPQGPLPPEIYWRRRIVAGVGGLAFVGLVLMLIISALPSSSDDQKVAATSSAPAAPTSAKKPPAAPQGDQAAGQQGQGGGPAPQGAGTNNQNNDQAAPQGPAAPTEAARQAPAPVPADNLCTDQSLSVVLYTDKATYKVGDQPVFTIAVTNGGLTECVRDIGKSAQNVVVRSLDGTRTLWSARDCSPLRTVKNVTFAPGQQERDTITWSGTTSTPGCKTPREPVPPGAYRAVGKIGERESAPITFNVVAPAQQP